MLERKALAKATDKKMPRLIAFYIHVASAPLINYMPLED